jgi:hypothetical protein
MFCNLSCLQFVNLFILACTLQANSFKIWDSAAGSQIEEIVVRIFSHRLTLVAIVVHVETLATAVGFAPVLFKNLKKLIFRLI